MATTPGQRRRHGVRLGRRQDGAPGRWLTVAPCLRSITPSPSGMTRCLSRVSRDPGWMGESTRRRSWHRSIAVGPHGDLYLDDATNWYRTVDPAGIIHAFAGTGARGYSGDSGPATQATFADDFGAVATDARGMSISATRATASSGRSTRRGRSPPWSGQQGYPTCPRSWRSTRTGPSTSPTGGPTSLANSTRPEDGLGRRGWSRWAHGSGDHLPGDCGPAVHATMSGPTAIAVHDGLLYVVDSFNARVRVVVL